MRVEVYGLKGDGTPPIVQDSFEYTTGACPLSLDLRPEALVLAAERDGPVVSQTVSLTASNSAAAPFAATDDADWLSVSPAAGNTPATLTLSGNPSGLSQGTYTATVNVSAEGLPSAQLEVSMVVSEPGGHTLLVSTSPDRAGASPLSGQTVQGDIYVFTFPDLHVRRVTFYLDASPTSGDLHRVEGSAPFDFAGGSVSTANPFDTRTLPNGPHTIAAVVTDTSGVDHVTQASFQVNN
jgi:hypothetical protein